MADWSERLGERRRRRVLLVTGEHQEAAVPTALRVDRKLFTCGPALWNDFDDRLLGGQYDLALVNGNHYPAARQIVFVDEAKTGTLERRRDQLTDVAGIVRIEEGSGLPDWLQERVATQATPPPVVSLGRVDELFSLIEQAVEEAVPPLHALLLAGGKSERMGQDKSQLVYRDGQTEVERLRDMCGSLGIPVNLSVRAVRDRAAEGGGGAEIAALPQIADRFVGLGPAGAICSAFLHDPDAAWLVLACDLPLLELDTLRKLVDARRPDRVATAVRGAEKEWPEPLVAIYEPRAYQRLLQFLSLGYSCPRKLLINSEVAVVELVGGRPLTNANTPAERAWVLKMIADQAVSSTSPEIDRS